MGLLNKDSGRQEAPRPAEGGTFVLGPSGTKVRVPEAGALDHADADVRTAAERQMAEAETAAQAHADEQARPLKRSRGGVGSDESGSAAS